MGAHAQQRWVNGVANIAVIGDLQVEQVEGLKGEGWLGRRGVR